MSEQIKRAWSDRPKHIIVAVFGMNTAPEVGVDIPTATELRDQLTVAIQEAERPSPFEEYWDKTFTRDYVNISKDEGRQIWDAALKLQKKETFGTRDQ